MAVVRDQDGTERGPRNFLGGASLWQPSYRSGRIPFLPKDPTTEEHLSKLRQFVGELAPSKTAFHGASKVSVPTSLLDWKCVFVRRDMHHNPLQKPYDVPFKVIQPGGKVFKIQVGGREETVTTDRLKPEQLEPSHRRHPAS